MKIKNLQGDVADVSAEKEWLVTTEQHEIRQRDARRASDNVAQALFLGDIVQWISFGEEGVSTLSCKGNQNQLHVRPQQCQQNGTQTIDQVQSCVETRMGL